MRMGFHALLQVGFLGDLLPVPAIPDQPHAPTIWGLSNLAQDADSLEAVLHLAQLGHDGDGVSLAGGLLDLWVLIAHVSQPQRSHSARAVLPEAS